VTRKVLLKDARIKIYICSRRCEHEYFETLHGKDKPSQEVLRYLDRNIARIKKYERCCWMIALSGVVMILLSVFLANIPAIKEQLIGPYLFLIGIVPITSSMLFISQLIKEEEKLVEKRKQLASAYSY